MNFNRIVSSVMVGRPTHGVPAILGTPPSFSSAPVIISTPTVGSACSCTNSVFSGTAPITQTFQWTLNGSNIVGATSATYTPITGDVGGTLRRQDILSNISGGPITSGGLSAGATVVASAGNTVTANFTLSRSSGVAPFALYVNARTSTSNITQANSAALGGTFRQLNYDWNFGDSGAGNHVVTGLPRNTQNGGPIAAKIYDGVADGAATSFPVTLLVTAGHPWRTHATNAPTAYVVSDLVTQGGNTYVCATAHTPGTFATDLAASRWTLFQSGLIQDSKTLNVAVTSGNTAYPTTATIYVSPSANYGSAPAGATLRTTLPTMASNKRVLLRNGESGYGDFDLNGLTDCHVIGVGAGARAACNRVTFSGTRNVVQGISTTLGLAGMNGIDNLQIGCTVSHTDNGATTIAWGSNNTDVYTNCVRAFIVGNTVTANTTSDASMYGGGRGFVVMDNDVGDAKQHTYRSYGAYEAYVAHNRFNGPVFDGSKMAFKQHSLGLVQWPTTSASGQYATEFCVQADNIMGHTGSTSNWTSDDCPENFDATTVEGVSDMIYERNSHIRSGTVNTDFLYAGRRITMRGNSRPSGALNISNVKDASGAGGVVGSNNSTYRNNWLDNGFAA